MGEYTPQQKFYLIDPSEFVNVENDINYNYRWTDKIIKPLISYQVTDVQSITDANLDRGNGYKWYKTYNNTVWNWNTNAIHQDGNAYVPPWSNIGVSIVSGYEVVPEYFPEYSVDYTGWVEWRGRIRPTGTTQLPKNANINFLTIPASVQPIRSKYFFVSGGDSTSNFQGGRLFVPSPTENDPRMEFCLYGGNGTSNDSRYIDLSCLRYPLDDTLGQ